MQGRLCLEGFTGAEARDCIEGGFYTARRQGANVSFWGRGKTALLEEAKTCDLCGGGDVLIFKAQR